MRIPAKYTDYAGRNAYTNGVRSALLIVIKIRAQSALKYQEPSYVVEMLRDIVDLCEESETEEMVADEMVADADEVAEDQISQRQISEDADGIYSDVEATNDPR